MSVLAVDLGITTGFAFFESDGTLLETGCVTSEHLLSRLKPFAATSKQIIIERPLLVGQGKLATKLADLILLMKWAYPSAFWITADRWKGTRSGILAKNEAEDLGLPTAHEKDAFAIARWYFGNPPPEKSAV